MELSPDEEAVDPLSEEQCALLKNGVLLLAHDELQDPNFLATIVCICIYSRDGGAYGLVLNRPSHMPLSEIFDGCNEASEPRRIFIGGPVQQDEMQIIQVTDTPVADSHEIAPRVYLGGKWENIDQALLLDGDSTRLFLGYSGWSPGQLEAEIRAGAWQVFDRIDFEKLLMNPERTIAADVKSIAEYLDTIRS